MRGALVIICMLAANAHAEDVVAQAQPWYHGRPGKLRIVHVAATGVGFVVYPILGFVEDGVTCRWCGGPNAVDAGVRDALLWSPDHIDTAARISDVTAYVLTPTASLSLVLAGTLASPNTALFIDDVIPVLETMVVTEWVTRGLKVELARTRPYAHFTGERGSEDNLSFPSGHTSRAFALAASAGFIAHARGYRSEPYLWASGITLAAVSGYLRIAADRHYLTDVVTGAAIGVSAGLTVPLLMRRTRVVPVPTRSGIAFVADW